MRNDKLKLIPENIINDYLNRDFTSLVVCQIPTAKARGLAQKNNVLWT